MFAGLWLYFFPLGMTAFLIFRCLCGALNSKTIVFVSSNLYFIRAADKIVILKSVSIYVF